MSQPRGRPSAYDPAFCEQARKLCLLGMTDAELGAFFGVDERTINRWKDDYPDFCQSMADGKENADADVAEKLYRRASGYSHPEVHVSNYQGAIILTPLIKHYPPDTAAASLWLRNRQSARWRDKTDIATQTLDKNGNPTDPVVPSLVVTIAQAKAED